MAALSHRMKRPARNIGLQAPRRKFLSLPSEPWKSQFRMRRKGWLRYRWLCCFLLGGNNFWEVSSCKLFSVSIKGVEQHEMARKLQTYLSCMQTNL